MDINWKSYLDIHFPYIAKVYINESDLSSVNASIQKRNDNLKFENENCATTFYDLFIQVIQPEIGTVRTREVSFKIMNFLDNQIRNFIESVEQNDNLIKQLKKQLNNLFKVNGDKYLDKIGELASTNYLIKQFGVKNLKSLEYKFENKVKGNKSKDVDIVFLDSFNDLILIEVINLNLDFKKIENEEKLLKLLNHRLSEKIKNKELDSDFIKANFKTVLIQPFIWIFDIATIVKYNIFFKNLKIENTLPILCLRQMSGANNKIFYDCVKIQEINKDI